MFILAYKNVCLLKYRISRSFSSKDALTFILSCLVEVRTWVELVTYVHSLSVSFRFQESQTQGGARQVMRPYKWRDVWQQENHTLVLMIRLLLSVLVHAMQFSRTLSSQIAVSVSNGRVWVWLSVWGRGGRQAARAGQRTEERKVNTPCLLLVYFLITAHLLNYLYTWLWLQVCLAWAVHRVDGSR